MALEMVENQKPDSAITILNSINQTNYQTKTLPSTRLFTQWRRTRRGRMSTMTP